MDVWAVTFAVSRGGIEIERLARGKVHRQIMAPIINDRKNWDVEISHHKSDDSIDDISRQTELSMENSDFGPLGHFHLMRQIDVTIGISSLNPNSCCRYGNDQAIVEL
jgi:hypothetical protein